jgi:hypothetical protein
VTGSAEFAGDIDMKHFEPLEGADPRAARVAFASVILWAAPISRSALLLRADEVIK